MLFRQAKLTDVTSITDILRQAAAMMEADGNPQWTAFYPGESDVIADVQAGNARVLCDDTGAVVAYGALIFTGEPAYNALEGNWLSHEKYAVVHRMAVVANLNGRGLGRRFLKLCENEATGKGCRSMRVDTKDTNRRMLSLLQKCGYEYCGEVRYDIRIRRAFEKLI